MRAAARISTTNIGLIKVLGAANGTPTRRRAVAPSRGTWLSPNDPTAHFNLGVAHVSLDMHADAFADFLARHAVRGTSTS